MISTAELKIAEKEDRLVQIQGENTKLLSEVQELNTTLELNMKGKEEMAANFEELKVNAKNNAAEFAAFKATQDQTILNIKKEKEDLSTIKNCLQVRFFI